MGGYVHPADQLSNFNVAREKEKQTLEVLDLITQPEPDIMLEILKESFKASRQRSFVRDKPLRSSNSFNSRR